MNFYRVKSTKTNLCILCSLCADTWDCVATCFFIDTAHNVIDYIDTIWKILKPGGIWINVGKCDHSFWLIFDSFLEKCWVIVSMQETVQLKKYRAWQGS